MSTDSESETESAREKHPSLEDLKSWKVNDLKEWLSRHGLKKSGTKDVLMNRIYRAMNASIDSDNESEDDIHTAINSVDIVPIHLVSNAWKPIEYNDIPVMTEKDVDSYFLYHKNPTTGILSNFERQMKKAKRFNNEGFIKEIEFNAVKEGCNYCYIRCKCLPSMRQTVQVGNLGKTSTSYSLNVYIKKASGHIIRAECNCKAGASGLCAHVGGLLYNLVKMKGACTSNECSWDRPRPLQRKPSPKRVCDINFYKTDKEKLVATKVKPYPGVYQAGPCNDSDTFLSEILDGLKYAYPQSVLYQTLTAEQADISSFLNLFSPNFMFADHIKLDSEKCVDSFIHFLDNLTVTDDISSNLEKGTRGQHINQNWKDARSVLITASVMGEIVKRKKAQPDNLVKKICGYVKIPDTVKSLKYGRKYESVAIEHYVQNHLNSSSCKNVQVESRGLLVNPMYPYVGASIDGFVNCDECGPGLVEVKCPYGSDSSIEPWRQMLPTECGKDPSFFCEERDGKLFLKEQHNYMFQIQGQLAVYELNWVDFVVWTKKGINVERVYFSADIWKTMLSKLKAFYLYGIAPELFSRRIMRGKPLY